MFEDIRFDDPQLLAILAWLGLVGTLIGIILAFIFSKRTPRPRPAYRLHTRNILQAGDRLSKQGVAILYKEQAVSRLTRTVIVIWNAGVGLKGEDVRPEYPIGWAFPESTSVLEVRVLSTTKEAVHFDAYKNPVEPNVVLCKFDYLNGGDGASLEILHTGDKQAPKPVGEILNVSPTLAYFAPFRQKLPRKCLRPEHTCTD